MSYNIDLNPVLQQAMLESGRRDTLKLVQGIKQIQTESELKFAQLDERTKKILDLRQDYEFWRSVRLKAETPAERAEAMVEEGRAYEAWLNYK